MRQEGKFPNCRLQIHICSREYDTPTLQSEFFEYPNTRAELSRRRRVTDAARSLPWDIAIGQIVVESLCKTQLLGFHTRQTTDSKRTFIS
jgi:hypothetical protein